MASFRQMLRSSLQMSLSRRSSSEQMGWHHHLAERILIIIDQVRLVDPTWLHTWLQFAIWIKCGYVIPIKRASWISGSTSRVILLHYTTLCESPLSNDISWEWKQKSDAAVVSIAATEVSASRVPTLSGPKRPSVKLSIPSYYRRYNMETLSREASRMTL